MKISGAVLFLVVSSILFFVFYKPQLKIEFRVTRVNKDTTFQNPIWEGSDGYGRHVSLRAIGELDSQTEVFIKDPDFSNKFLSAELPKGKFDTTWVGEYYEKKAEIVYLHKKTKKGDIKITFRYLTPNADTLAEPER